MLKDHEIGFVNTLFITIMEYKREVTIDPRGFEEERGTLSESVLDFQCVHRSQHTHRERLGQM